MTRGVEVEIERVVAGGSGITRVDGEVVFVPRVAPGERVVIEIDRSKKPARGRVLKVLSASPDRVDPPCAIVEKCGGCDLMHLAGGARRDVLVSIVRGAVPSIADVEISFHSASKLGERTRARWHGKRIGPRVAVGYRAAGAHTIVEPTTCVALDPRLDAAWEDARALLAESKGEGEIHAALGEGGRPVLAIEWRGEVAPSTWRIAEERVQSGRLAGVEVAIDGAKSPAIIGDPHAIERHADGGALRTPSRGFAQASDAGDAALVNLVVARAKAEGLAITELFAGSGNLTVALARVASHVTAVELSVAACKAGRQNLAARGLEKKAKFVEADADTYVITSHAPVLVLDPPRTGAAGAMRVILERKPRRVVYVSCDPATLGRDLGKLVGPYRVESFDLVDLFPATSHVESIVTLAL